jgi:hypothetical protein
MEQINETKIMKITELYFQRYTLLNKDETIKIILDKYEKEPNKKNIKYIYSYDDGGWCFIEG